MVNYEGLFIIDSDLATDAAKAALQSVSDIITKNGGTVADLQEWGRRRLAYLVRNRREGNYVLVNFSINPESITRINSLVRLNEQILKHMITKKLPPKVVVERSPGARASADATAA